MAGTIRFEYNERRRYEKAYGVGDASHGGVLERRLAGAPCSELLSSEGSVVS
jgi:hypothetical protein